MIGSRIVTSAPYAAFANGMLAHADETDDVHAASHTHPPPPGSPRGEALDDSVAYPSSAPPPANAQDRPREHPSVAKKNCLKPWRKLMWCIGVLTEEYRRRMYDLLDLYPRPLRINEPVVCVDEKSKQLLKDTRISLPAKPRTSAKQDYEYKRASTCNLFVAIEPQAGRRTVRITDHRAKVDFVDFTRYLLEHVYHRAQRVHFVLDNLNTHFRECFVEVLGIRAARALLRRVEFSISCVLVMVGNAFLKPPDLLSLRTGKS